MSPAPGSTSFWDSRQLDPALATPADFDAEGFLREPSRWHPALAAGIAAGLGLQLGPDHYRVLDACRDFYQRYQRMPTTRAFVKHLGQTLGDDWGQSQRLLQHFPNTPMRLVALCAGLPKPPNCF